MNAKLTLAWGVAALGAGCAAVPGNVTLSESDAVSLSIASEQDPLLRVGDQLGFVVRAVSGDGVSQDVTGQASCALSDESVGSLEGALFTATAPGVADIECSFGGASDQLRVNVEGTANVYEIQAGEFAEGVVLDLEPVVVTARLPVPDSDCVDLFVQAPDGGVNSGLLLEDYRADCSEAFEVGDALSARGVYLEASGRSILEVEALTRESSLSTDANVLSFADLELSAYESALVQIEGGVVADALYSSVSWLVTPDGDPSTPGYEADLLLYEPPVTTGQVVESLTGVVFCSQEVCAIAPRSEADVVLRSGDTGTDDPMMDPDPVMQDPALTPKDLHDGNVADGAAVELSGLVVYALREDGSGIVDLWAQSEGGGARSGIHLRDERAQSGALDVAPGDVVDVVGEFALRAGQPVVYFSAVTATGSAAPVVDAVPFATLLSSSADWVGGLVEVTGVEVVTPDAGGYGFEVAAPADLSSAVLVADDLMGPQTVATGDSLSSVTGAVYTVDAEIEIWPRSAADLVWE